MKLIPVKSVLSKWLLTAIILLGFFTFSGPAIQTSNRFDKPHTTLVAGYTNRISKSILYSATLKGVNRNTISALISGTCSLLALSFLHSLQTHTVVKQTSWLFIPNNQIKYHSFIKVFGSDSADDSYSL
ncbi:hypothetical protein ACEN9X_24660 [Mucilaginibacter sp. Mucisp86]|uniref:hypothetical protein n=1 Tax=Mucilaginibacter sp. Mucisp86 TaxID=3243060 RepID=UPI0039B37CC0